MGAGRWIGRGDKIAADQAAVDGMRAMLDTVAMDGTVVIGEGEKDEAPMLFNGESVGDGSGPPVDVAVDPLEGTRLTALGQPNAIAVIAVAERGTMFFPGAAVYMEKIAVGPDAIDVDRHRGVADGERQRRREGEGRHAARAVGRRARARAAQRSDRRVARGGREGEPDPRRRRCARDRGRAGRHGRRRALRHRRHARRRHLRRCAEVRRRRHPGTALAARRRRAAQARRGRARSRARAHDGRPRRRERRLRRCDGRHDGLAAPRRPLRAERRRHRLDRDALALRDGAHGRRRGTISRSSRRTRAANIGNESQPERTARP